MFVIPCTSRSIYDIRVVKILILFALDAKHLLIAVLYNVQHMYFSAMFMFHFIY